MWNESNEVGLEKDKDSNLWAFSWWPALGQSSRLVLSRSKDKAARRRSILSLSKSFSRLRNTPTYFALLAAALNTKEVVPYCGTFWNFLKVILHTDESWNQLIPRKCCVCLDVSLLVAFTDNCLSVFFDVNLISLTLKLKFRFTNLLLNFSHSTTPRTRN